VKRDRRSAPGLDNRLGEPPLVTASAHDDELGAAMTQPWSRPGFLVALDLFDEPSSLSIALFELALVELAHRASMASITALSLSEMVIC